MLFDLVGLLFLNGIGVYGYHNNNFLGPISLGLWKDMTKRSFLKMVFLRSEEYETIFSTTLYDGTPPPCLVFTSVYFDEWTDLSVLSDVPLSFYLVCKQRLDIDNMILEVYDT